MTEETHQKRERVHALRSEIAALLDLHDDLVINATLAHLIAAQLSRYEQVDRKRLRTGFFGLTRRLIPRYEQVLADTKAVSAEWKATPSIAH